MKMFTVESEQSITKGISLSFIAKLMNGYSDFCKKNGSKEQATLDKLMSNGGALVVVRNGDITSIPDSAFKLAENARRNSDVGFFVAYETPTSIKLLDGSQLHLGLALDGTLRASATKPFEYGKPPCSEMEEQATNWLRTGERGASSETMCCVLCGIEVRDSDDLSYPYDASDFRRCLKFLEAVPTAREKLEDMSEVSPHWRALINNWTKLESLMSDPVTLSTEMKSLLSEVDDQHDARRFA